MTGAAGGRPAGRSCRGLAYATQVRAAPVLAEFTTGQFLASLDVLAEVYAAAMAAPPYQLPGRRSIMARHAGYPAFRAVAAVLPPGNLGHNGDRGRGPAGEPVVGFAYGFHGRGGQWWHDLVCAALADRHGRRAARTWLGNSFEIAEVHVHPDYQGRGTGHAMLLRLAEGRPEHTAVLSTMDADTSARRLYRGVGFADLLPGFIFPGATQPYTIMGATLPLPGPGRPGQAADRCPASPGSR
jgi:GNAT superfamily N-acetyltransferase